MNPFAARSLPIPIREHHAKGLVGPRLTVVFFGVSSELMDACELRERGVPLARVEAKHLFAACTALSAFESAMLVVSTTIRPWDRDVIVEHARKAKASILWVGTDPDVGEITSSISTWATAAMRSAVKVIERRPAISKFRS